MFLVDHLSVQYCSFCIHFILYSSPLVILFEMFSKVISLVFLRLKFTQTPTPSKNKLKADVEKNSRHLRLAEFFNEFNDSQKVHKPFGKNKRTFHPPSDRDQHLDTFISYVQKTL